MSGKQHAVMWLGLLLVITRMFTTGQWKSIWSVVGGSGITTAAAVTVKGGPVPAANIQDWTASGGSSVQLALWQRAKLF